MDDTTKQEIWLQLLGEIRQLRTNSDAQTKILRNLQASLRGPTAHVAPSGDSKRRDALLERMLTEA